MDVTYSGDKLDFLTTARTARVLGVSLSTIYRMVDQGILRPIKTPGGQRRFRRSELEQYMEESRNIMAPQNPSRQKTQPRLFSIKEELPLLECDAVSDAVKETEEPVVDSRNTLNDLTGREWLLETKSYFFQKGLGASHPHAQIERLHPAPFSFQDIGRLVLFFTKKGQRVLDPFGGVGSTAKACAVNGRLCTSIELSEHWHSLAKKRLETEVGIGSSDSQQLICGDCRDVLREMESNTFDFMVTSPPYWSILNKKADHKVRNGRILNNLATNYSDDERDLGNIADYDRFVDILVNDVFLECARVIKPKKYMCLVVSDFRNKSQFVSFHSDLIQRMNNRAVDKDYQVSLQGIKILLQNHKSLLPYGYPFAYVENIHHQYILIFRKGKIGR